jgi:hypothetical protein
MKSRSKFRPSDNRQRRLGFARPQLEALEERLQPSTVLSGQEWAYLAADPLEPDPELAAYHDTGSRHLRLNSGQEEKKPLPTPAATAPVPSGDRQAAYGAIAQPAVPSQLSSQNSAPAVANPSLALAGSAKAPAPSTLSASPTTVSRSFGARQLTELPVTVHLASQVMSPLSPALTHSVHQQINTAASESWVTYVTGTPTLATGQAVTVDSLGDAYVTGAMGAGGFQQAFVAVYDPFGNPIIPVTPFQAVDVGANGSPVVHYTRSEGTGIALDGNGNIYVVGTATNPSTRAREAFVMRFNSSGNVDPTYGVGINSVGINLQTLQPEYLNVAGSGIVVGPDGTATLVGTGNFQDQTTFAIRQDIFLVQVDPTGVIVTLPDGNPYAFGFNPGSFGNDSQGNPYTGSLGTGIAVSPDGTTGYVSGTLLDGSAGSVIVVLSFPLANADTGVSESIRGTPAGPTTSGGIAVGSDGTVYQAATGTYLDPDTQQISGFPDVFSWGADLSGPLAEGLDQSLPGGMATGIAVDPTGNVYLTGSGIDPSGVQRAFVDFYPPAGGQFTAQDQYLTGQAPAGSGQEAGWGVAYSNANNTVFLVGDTTSSNLSTDITTLNGTQDAFLANIGNFG